MSGYEGAVGSWRNHFVLRSVEKLCVILRHLQERLLMKMWCIVSNGNF